MNAPTTELLTEPLGLTSVINTDNGLTNPLPGITIMKIALVTGGTRGIGFSIIKFNGVDILINNAGISPKLSNGKRIPTQDIDDREWDLVMETNLKSVFLMCKYFFNVLKAKHGKIINIASMMGATGSGIDNHQIFPYSVSAAHYSASKAGVINFTKSLAREFSEFNIPVYAIAPGAVSGGMGKFSEGFIKNLKEQIPSHQLGTPGEIVDTLAILLTSGMSLTGQTLHVNHGWYMGG